VKITIVNGSPKKKGSGSGIIIQECLDKIGSTADCTVFETANQDNTPSAFTGCDALVFVFPLYVDGIPSHLLRLMDEMCGEIGKLSPKAAVYAIVNNGFCEGRQNHIALEMMRNFSACTKLTWGQGLGIGAGGMIGSSPIGRGPMKNLGIALDQIVQNILTGKTGDDFYIAPNFPKALYRISGHISWKVQARKNGLKTKDLYGGNL
jgi:multimeric flavodoxin WrbA